MAALLQVQCKILSRDTGVTGQQGIEQRPPAVVPALQARVLLRASRGLSTATPTAHWRPGSPAATALLVTGLQAQGIHIQRHAAERGLHESGLAGAFTPAYLRLRWPSELLKLCLARSPCREASPPWNRRSGHPSWHLPAPQIGCRLRLTDQSQTRDALGWFLMQMQL